MGHLVATKTIVNEEGSVSHQWSPDDTRFLGAWKEAVNATGKHLYKVRSSTVSAAKNRNELCPDFDAIEHHLKTTPGDHTFLIAVLQFYPHQSIDDICAELDITAVPRLPELKQIPELDRMILVRLMNLYDGWDKE